MPVVNIDIDLDNHDFEDDISSIPNNGATNLNPSGWIVTEASGSRVRQLDDDPGSAKDGVLRLFDTGSDNAFPIVSQVSQSVINHNWMTATVDLDARRVTALSGSNNIRLFADIDGDGTFSAGDIVLGQWGFNASLKVGTSEKHYTRTADLSNLSAADRAAINGAKIGVSMRVGQGLNAKGSSGVIVDNIELSATVCFAAGTLIDTIDGPCPVEKLTEQTLVRTQHNGYQPILWTGVSTRLAQGDCAPIRIKAGALDNETDLIVSPQHKLLVTGWRAELHFGTHEILVPAKALVNGTDILCEPAKEMIDYWHVLLDGHQIIYANGAPAESLHVTENSMDLLSDDQLQDLEHRFPFLLLVSSNTPMVSPAARVSEAFGLL